MISDIRTICEIRDRAALLKLFLMLLPELLSVPEVLGEAQWDA